MHDQSQFNKLLKSNKHTRTYCDCESNSFDFIFGTNIKWFFNGKCFRCGKCSWFSYKRTMNTWKMDCWWWYKWTDDVRDYDTSGVIFTLIYDIQIATYICWGVIFFGVAIVMSISRCSQVAQHDELDWIWVNACLAGRCHQSVWRGIRPTHVEHTIRLRNLWQRRTHAFGIDSK